MEHRWQLIDPPPCAGAITLSGAGFIDPASDINADYCPNGDVNGRPSWVRVGGNPDSTSDSVFWESTGTPQWEARRGGTLVYTNPDGMLRPKNGTWVPAFAPPDQPPVWSKRVDNVVREVFPTCGAGDFEEVQDLAAGQIFYRWKITHSLLFIKDDFKYFERIERRNRCGEMLIRYQMKCGGMWLTHWTGRFSAGGGRLQYTHCQFEVKPETVDDYTCILDNMDRKVNLLELPPVTTNCIIISSGIEFGVCDMGSSDPPTECSNQFQPAAQWVLAHSWVPFGGSTHKLYWRERVTTPCVAGTPVPPPGTGWALLLNNSSGLYDAFMEPGTAAYVRSPTITYTFGDPEYCPTPTPDCCVPSMVVSYWNAQGYSIACLASPEYDAENCAQYRLLPYADSDFRVCLSAATPIELRSRSLHDCLNYVLEKTDCDIPEVVSDFFEWNPTGDALGYAPGINYVTGGTNQVNQVVVVQNSDAINPTATNPATRGETTLRELLAMFLATFRVYWDLDKNGSLRLESRKHWTFPVGLDLTSLTSPHTVVEDMERSGLDRDIPKIERLKFAHAQGQDFVGADLTYSGPCVSENQAGAVKEYSVGPFTTDIVFIQTDPDGISRQGFTLLATTFDGSEYSTIIVTGALSGFAVTNAPLSVANVQRDYWGWDRYLAVGNVNGQDVRFGAFLPTVKQPEVLVKCFACQLKNFDAKKRVRTGLGQKYLQGATAEVEKARIDHHGHLRLTLRYPR